MPFRRRKQFRRNRLMKRLTIAIVSIAAALALGSYFFTARSRQSDVRQPHKITLRWNKAPHAKSYIVYRRPDRVATYLKLGATVEPSFEDRAVEAGQHYCYQVTTVESHGRESVPSPEMCVNVPEP